MGFLNNTAVTVDAILTAKGRELLAKGDGSFRITQFALADDEIDYTLYNPYHPSGSAFYGQAIDNMPLLEAFPDETQAAKYMLVTLPRGTSKMPTLNIGLSLVTLKQGASLDVKPQTLNYLGNTTVVESSGYTFTISDIRLMKSFQGAGINTQVAIDLNATQTIGTNVSKTVIGTVCNMTGTTVNTLFAGNNIITGTLQIVGRDSGARLQVPIQITQN